MGERLTSAARRRRVLLEVLQLLRVKIKGRGRVDDSPGID